MKAGLVALFALLLLVLVSAAALTVHGIRYLPVEAAPPALSAAPAPPAAPPPAPERVRNPQAVLLLDVSGSMAAVSDRNHLQTEAVLHFYRTFQALAPEVLEPGETASVAIVTFGTGAELLTWDGEPFLTASPGNEAAFTGAIVEHLGRVGLADPRQDQWTESSAALLKARELLAHGGDRTGPPAVILLTDGKPEAEGRDLASLQEEARAELGRLLAEERPFGDRRAPPVWAPVLLLGGRKAAETEAIGRETFWDEPTRRTSRAAWPGADVITCRQPDQMVSRFVDVLARWLGLEQLAPGPRPGTFTVPQHTQAFAVQVETASTTDSVVLEGPGGSHPLQGSGRFWGGVVSGETAGTWNLRPSSGGVRSSTVHLRSRYAWYLSVSPSWTVAAGADPAQAHLYLCRRGSSRCEPGQEDFDTLPDSLPGRVVDTAGTEYAVTFQRVAVTGAPPPAYTARLPAGPTGSVRIAVDSAALVATRLPTTGVLDGTFQVQHEVPLAIADWEGQPVGGVKVGKAPRIPGWVGVLLGGQP